MLQVLKSANAKKKAKAVKIAIAAQTQMKILKTRDNY
jgi:hypothetical protein